MHASFGGIPCVQHASFTMKQGVTPSTGRATFAIDSSPPLCGVFILSDGIRTISISPAYLVDPVIVRHDSGAVIEATIADRRILWKYGYVTGKYNIPDDMGIPKEERKIQDLLQDCLTINYGVVINFFSVPEGLYPPVDWEFENPASAAQELCEKYGLSISLDVSGNAYIGPAAFDRTIAIPTADPMSSEQSFNDPYKPIEIWITGSRKINQICYELYPIGIEKTTNELKKIDELSYKPAEGWGKAVLNDFYDIADDEAKKLAEKCIFKWYAYVPLVLGDRKKYLPWLAHISEVAKVLDENEGTYVSQRAMPYIATGNIKTDEVTSWNPSTLERYKKEVTFDLIKGIVKFPEYIFQIKNYTSPVQALTEVEKATVRIMAAYEINTGSADDFYKKKFPVAGGTLSPYIVSNKELTEYQIEGVANSEEKVALDAYAANVAQAILDTWEHISPWQWEFPFLATVEVYGDIKSVTWQVGEQGATSIVSTGVEEIVPFIPSYQERALQKKSAALHWPSTKRIDEQSIRRKTSL